LQRLQADGVELTKLEIYPNADQGLGHPVRLPLGVHRRTGKRYPLLDSHGEPMTFRSQEAAVSFILAQPHVPLSWLKASWHVPAGDDDAPTHPHTAGTTSPVIRWVDTHISPLAVLVEYAPDAAMRKVGQGYLGWCPFHDDQAAQADGSPGTPSFYVVQHHTHGWLWRCLSSNCQFHGLPSHRSFRLFCELVGCDARTGIDRARKRWPDVRRTYA
jgi:hypothetical protein